MRGRHCNIFKERFVCSAILVAAFSPAYGSANIAQQRVEILLCSNHKYFVDKMFGKKTFDLWTLAGVI